MRKKHKKLSVERNRVKAGWLFMLPWIFGVINFFFIPFFNTIRYSLSDVFIEANKIGLQTKFLGIYNYEYIFLRDASYVRTVVNSVLELLYTVPIILVFSIFIALLLNQEYHGRVFMRAIFFLPVIIASGVVMKVISADVFTQNILNDSSGNFQTGAISEMLLRAGLPDEISNIITDATANIFDLSWKSGIQILLFISALQGVPSSYYEAASIEGANKWDAFWKITFPILSPTILLVTIYSIIDSFIDAANPVMTKMMERFDSLSYGFASASAVIYFFAIILVVGFIFLIFGRKIFSNG